MRQLALGAAATNHRPPARELHFRPFRHLGCVARGSAGCDACRDVAAFSVTFPALLARWWRIPFLYYVKDVYPEAAEKTGFISNNGLFARFCRFLDRRLCLSSAKVIVISESMRDLIAHSRGLSTDRFAVIPDWIDPDEFVPQPIDNAWRREQNIPNGTFVVMFGGTLGYVSGAEILVDVARLLRERRDILIVCIGEGIRKRRMIEQCRSLGLENIRFLPFQPRQRIAEVQGAANVTVLTMRPGYSDASVPSKLISYFAAGRAVVCAATNDCAVSRIVSESGAGVIVKPGDPIALARAISELFLCSADTERMGRPLGYTLSGISRWTAPMGSSQQF